MMYNSAPHGQNNRKHMYNWHFVIAIEMGYTRYFNFNFSHDILEGIETLIRL